VKIISGGQTGVDRAALDVALKNGIDCGGWCPAGRLDEFGRIPDQYPVKELTRVNKEERTPDRSGGLAAFAEATASKETAAPWQSRGIFAERTFANVRDSDGTIIIYNEQIGGGTGYTLACCKHLQRPHQLIDACKFSADQAAKLIAEFVHKHEINVLNVAGPRQTEWAEGYDYAFRALDEFLRRSTQVDRSERGDEQIGT
jgi:putative molybdenum carrier protein